ncbi:MAG: pyrroline-5-carboxylate reductase [Deltaproteobacteria bacterium]|nr:pyrroline-5-carboxylate reductase [Deltaproteobacteria bacterium]
MNFIEKRIGFIGAGNMAGALIKGIIASGLFNHNMINASDNDPEKIKALSNSYKVEGILSNRELCDRCNIIVLSIKPQVMSMVLEEIKGCINKNHLVISIAAGIRINNIETILGADVPVIRVMPNTPALVQMGVSAIAAGRAVTPEHMNIAIDILKAVGIAFTVDEAMMDAVTAVSGSGPGFIFRLMECFVAAAQTQGFDPETSRNMVINTFLGAAILAQKSGTPLSELRKMVTSPGGTTEAGLKYMDENKIGEILDGTVEAAKNRSVELGKKM